MTYKTKRQHSLLLFKIGIVLEVMLLLLVISSRTSPDVLSTWSIPLFQNYAKGIQDKDYIKYAEFNVSYNALCLAYELDILCDELEIEHKRIRPRTPRHNGKVERSHRNDQERFYNHMSFYSYPDLLIQMKRYLSRSNRIPMQTLGWKSPLEKRHELMAQ